MHNSHKQQLNKNAQVEDFFDAYICVYLVSYAQSFILRSIIAQSLHVFLIYEQSSAMSDNPSKSSIVIVGLSQTKL